MKKKGKRQPENTERESPRKRTVRAVKATTSIEELDMRQLPEEILAESVMETTIQKSINTDHRQRDYGRIITEHQRILVSACGHRGKQF